MDDEEKIARLLAIGASEDRARWFLRMWEAMKEIEREEAEEERVAHATQQSLGENWRRGMARRGKPVR
jgi:hypothetical protein